jgi:murein DD-endopeptidase MepM/ murein hydrolase activator NlpD
MSKVGRSSPSSFARRKPPCRIFIARGEDVRTITMRPWTMVTLAVFAGLFGILYFGATFYLVFRDDLLAASIARQARIQHAYEDRIASLRADIDRLTSRQLINQQAFDAKMDRLIGRQVALDARQDMIAGLSQAARRVGLVASPVLVPGQTIDPTAAKSDRQKDPVVTGAIAPAQTGPAPIIASLFGAKQRPEPPPPAVRIGVIENSLDALAADQAAYVEAIAASARQKTAKIESVLTRLGYKPKVSAADGVGGPFVPVRVDADPRTFRSSIELVSAEIENLAAAKRTAASLPLARPIANSPITSGFGARLDPFMGRLAMHTGIDFRAGVGYPIRATAAGTVITAGYTGGYGKMVEIDHGNGLTTRYAHMSRILVKAGDVVAMGAVVGSSGSTGRSTGPHVHYEVRADGEALDPMRYIRAGGELAPLL